MEYITSIIHGIHLDSYIHIRKERKTIQTNTAHSTHGNVLDTCTCEINAELEYSMHCMLNAACLWSQVIVWV